MKKIALIGNPNVGKSTIFNILTGMHQHTGNWPGKTVSSAKGIFRYKDDLYEIVDLPGTYSLVAHSEEEEVSRDYILSNDYDLVIVVCDSLCLERNLNLVMQIKEVTNNVIVVVNLLDEAKKKNVEINLSLLEEKVDLKVVGCSARSNIGIDELKKCIIDFKYKKTKKDYHIIEKEDFIYNTNNKCKEIVSDVVKYNANKKDKRDKKIDYFLTNKYTAIPIMSILMLLIFWLTIKGANYPSDLLFKMFNNLNNEFLSFLNFINSPKWLSDMLVGGVFKTLGWVVAVMLPPMAIFFPLFTILEDLGILPRVAFNLDKAFQKCRACGKQSLCMMMGFGCNAAGVVGTRIIDSKRERLIAILTNSLIPCNGRFPSIIVILTIFMVGSSSSFLTVFYLMIVILVGVLMTFLISYILSRTILKGYPSSFTLELPPFRKPLLLKVIVRSIFDKTIHILARSVVVTIPVGIIVWLCANINIGSISILESINNFFDPFGKLIGLDGVILTAFILGFPANEIVLPIILMSYLQLGTLTDYTSILELKNILIANNWTILTAINMLIMILFHFPCATTCLTIRKETNSNKWMFISMIIPLILGITLCMITAFIYRLN